MKSASMDTRSELETRLRKGVAGSHEAVVFEHLRKVAGTFIQAQQRREEADYDTGKEWTQTDVLTLIVELPNGRNVNVYPGGRVR